MSEKLPKVVVCHPARQHSHQLAIGLSKYGLLDRYISGVPCTDKSVPYSIRRFFKRELDAYRLDLNPSFLEHIFVAPLLRRWAARMLSRAYYVDVAHRADAIFDFMAARRIRALRPDIVVGYENSALLTFRAAKGFGAKTVLDAASFHHAMQDQLFAPIESDHTHARIVRRKNMEIGLADIVMTVSELAANSYRSAAIQNVFSCPVGVDLDQFDYSRRNVADVSSRGIRFVYVGRISKQKGCDTLVRSFVELQSLNPEIGLTVIGSVVDNEIIVGAKGIKYIPQLSHSQLAEELNNHDVLVLPSAFDSFGMVVVEAMACGLPAIVSEHVGARELVVPGKTGHIVRFGDHASLMSAMSWYIDHRDLLPSQSTAAAQMASNYSWTAYHARAVQIITGGNS